MRKRVFCLIICALCFANIAIANANTPQIDLSSPETTVRSFVASLNQYNFKQAALCVESADPDKMAQLSDWEKDLRKVHMTLFVSNLQSATDDTNATVTSTITIKVGKSQETNDVTKSYLRLHKHSEKWQIIPDDPQKIKSIGSQDYLGYTAAFLAHPEAFDNVREAARGNSCRSNLKQLALAMQIFVQDHNGVYAITDNTLTESLKPYIRNNSIYICPSNKTPHLQTNGDKTSYSFNTNIEGVSQSSIKNPSQVVLFYEGKDGKLNFRHNGEACVAFVDGTTKLINEKDAADLRWK